MKQLLILLFCFAAVSASARTQIKLGTYNIKSYSSSTIEQHQWGTRKKYVVQVVKDNAYDIIGMNEIRSIGNQRDDINSMMEEANFGVVEGNSTEANACFNNIYYKKDLFHLIDCGIYFLSPDGAPRLAWDMNNSLIRFTTWAKFQAIATGDIFYFFSTHHDVSGSFARYEETRINVDSVRRIAGCYPAFLAGDFNSSSGDAVFYNYATAFMEDCRLTAHNVVAPIGDGTLCHHSVDGVEVWDPLYSAVRLDFIFAKNVKSVDEYVNVNTSYVALKNECPSDHFAIQATVTIEKEKAEDFTVRYNPSSGEDLQEAIDRCMSGGTVMIMEGMIKQTTPLHISKSISIVGGYNSDFSAIVGSTTLVGNGSSQVIVSDTKTALSLRNIDVCGGESATDGGGIYCRGSYLGLHGCSLHDNHAARNGAAVYANGQLEIDHCNIYNNKCEGNGAAFFTPLTYWRQSVVGSHIFSNKASVGPAGFIGGFCFANLIGNSIHNNEATNSGVMHIERTGTKSFATFANNTFANNISMGVGSAIETNQTGNGSLAIVNNTIVGNRSNKNDGCAVYVGNVATANICSNIIAGNEGGDCVIRNQDATVKSTCNTLSDNDCAAKLNIMLEGHIQDNLFIPYVNDAGIIPVRIPFFGSEDINDITSQMLEEKNFGGDVDNNAETNQRLVTDQTGKTRRTDGTASRGAVEADMPAAWDGISISEPKTIETGDYKGFYLITKPEELAWVAEVTQTSPFDGNLYIASDLDLGNWSWLPIGERFPFRGSIEGNNRLISRINISASNGQVAALIAQIDNPAAYINNLRLSGGIAAHGAVAAASLVGIATAMKSITHVHSAVEIHVDDADSCILGCIVGDAVGTWIAGCSYSGKTIVKGNARTGSFRQSAITSVYSSGSFQGTVADSITTQVTLVFQVGDNGITTEQLHNGELTRLLNGNRPQFPHNHGYFGQDMSEKNSVPVTINQDNPVFLTQYIVNDSLYHHSYNNHTLILPSNPNVEGYIFRGWYDAQGNLITSKTFIDRDTILIAHLEPLEKWDGTSIAEPDKIDNIDSPYYGWYQITKPSELAWVAAKSKASVFDGNLYIANDIDLDNRPWLPIGYNYNFNGSIQGNGNSIININLIPSASVKCYGLIGQTNNPSATISNLTITGNMLIETSSKSANIGGLIGKANAMESIANCHSQINITTKKGSLVSYLGGLVGLAKATKIISSSYSGDMLLQGGQVAKGWGGLVGTFNSTVEGDEGGLYYSWFSGKILSTTTVKPTYGAALVGYPSLAGGTCTIENCYACGEFTATTKPTNYGVIYAKKGTGTVTSNNYTVGLTATVSDGAITATQDQLHSGELCFMLNEGNTNTPYFYQNIDNGTTPDTIPLANKTHGIVYKHSRGIFSNFPEAPEAVEEVRYSKYTCSNYRYNLQGLRVGEDYKGIVIDGGKKYLVK